MKARAILFTGVNTVELHEVALPPLGDSELLIESAYTCISPGTEMRCLAGLQDNSPDWPFIPGYAMAGRVIEAGPNATTAPGTLVLCSGTSKSDVNRMWGGHVSHAIQTDGGVYTLSDGTDLIAASILRLASISYHGVALSKPQSHETVAVVGLGPIGQFSARLHAISGARVLAADLSPERVALASSQGIEAFVPEQSIADAFAQRIPDGADIVVDSTGSSRVLPQSLAVAKDIPWDNSLTPSARFVIQGSYPGDVVFSYNDAFMKQVAFLIPRDAQQRDMLAVIDLLHRGKLVARDLVSDVRKPEDAQSTYDELSASKGHLLTVAFQW